MVPVAAAVLLLACLASVATAVDPIAFAGRNFGGETTCDPCGGNYCTQLQCWGCDQQWEGQDVNAADWHE